MRQRLLRVVFFGLRKLLKVLKVHRREERMDGPRRRGSRPKERWWRRWCGHHRLGGCVGCGEGCGEVAAPPPPPLAPLGGGMLRMLLMVVRLLLLRLRVLLLLLLLLLPLLLPLLLVVLAVEAEAEHGPEERRVDGRRGRRGRQGRHRVLEPRVGVDPPSCDRTRELRMALSTPRPSRVADASARTDARVAWRERTRRAHPSNVRSVGWLDRRCPAKEHQAH